MTSQCLHKFAQEGWWMNSLFFESFGGTTGFVAVEFQKW